MTEQRAREPRKCCGVIALSPPPLLERYDPLPVEKWVLKFWRDNRIYELVKSKCGVGSSKLFRFLEGPPTANGYMHVGHARGRTFKDVILRYMRMRGYFVWDQAGWDTQGLPVELEVERALRFKSKKDIEKYGIDKFVEECQKLVDYYIRHWREASERLGLWLDYDSAYETRHPKYIESVWSFLKTVWERGLLYEALSVVPVCPRCETALSYHEMALGYKEVEDISLYFKVKLVDDEAYFVAWTTTPWTIVANEALAVHPHEIYVKMRVGDEVWIVAKNRVEHFVKEVGVNNYEIVEEFVGSKLAHKRYVHPLMEEVPEHGAHGPPNHEVVLAEWVKMDEGTGVVHIAPAHGPEDFEVARKYGISLFIPIGKNGVFSNKAGKYSGLWFKDAESCIIEDLRRKNLVVHVSKIKHEYPHCWRCETPLMYYADKQWFIKIEALKEKLLDEISAVGWYPEWAGKRFRDWVANAKDWCISRERYWGTPLPIWTCSRCGHRIVVGSFAELAKMTGIEVVKDLHRPWIDEITFACPRCGNTMVREPFVIDVWMDSGMAHTAALKQLGLDGLFDALFPYDWITEAVDQTRGWFYTLMLTSVAQYGKAPYRTVLCQGLVLDKYGKKMSKSRGNVIWALDFINKHGADPLRLYLLSKAAPWDNINFDPDEVEDVKAALNVLWNVIRFADIYMSLDKWRADSIAKDMRSAEPEDFWLLYELKQLVRGVEESISEGALHQAARMIIRFITETLSHRYVTVIRPRVWLEEDRPEKRSAYATLYTVIAALLKIMAPFAPFLSEYLYQAFVKKYGEGAESIHLEAWPSIESALIDERAWSIVNAMFAIGEEVLKFRAKSNVKRRWPLKRALLVVKEDRQLVEKAKRVLQVYANIKDVSVVESLQTEAPQGLSIPQGGLQALIDTSIDEDVVLEGLARDLIRRVQMFRKEKNLAIDGIIEYVGVYTEAPLLIKALQRYREFIARETRIATLELLPLRPEKCTIWSIEEQEVCVVFKL